MTPIILMLLVITSDKHDSKPVRVPLKNKDTLICQIPKELTRRSVRKIPLHLENKERMVFATLTHGPKIESAHPDKVLNDLATYMEDAMLTGSNQAFEVVDSQKIFLPVTAKKKKPNLTYTCWYEVLSWRYQDKINHVVVAVIQGRKDYYRFTFQHLKPEDRDLGLDLLKSFTFQAK